MTLQRASQVQVYGGFSRGNFCFLFFGDVFGSVIQVRHQFFLFTPILLAVVLGDFVGLMGTSQDQHLETSEPSAELPQSLGIAIGFHPTATPHPGGSAEKLNNHVGGCCFYIFYRQKLNKFETSRNPLAPIPCFLCPESDDPLTKTSCLKAACNHLEAGLKRKPIHAFFS